MSTESDDAPWRDKRDKAPTYLALATRLEKTLVRNRELERRCAELEGHLKGLLELFDDGSWSQWVTERLAAARAAVEKGKGNL